MEFDYNKEGLLQELAKASVEEGLSLELCYDPVSHQTIHMVDQVVLEDEVIRVKAYDAPRRCQLRITKRGSQGQLLQGVAYRLERVNEGDVWMQEAMTNTQGEIVWEDLVPGDYVLTETATLEGYELLTQSIPVTLPYVMTKEEAENCGADVSKAWYDENEGRYYFDTLYLEITDHASFRIPMAGGSTGIMRWMIFLAWCMIGCGMILMRGTRRAI